MSVSDEELRRTYQSSMTPSRALACPDTDAIRAVVERNGAESDRLSTLDHVMSCATCRCDLDVLRRIAELQMADLPRPAVRRSPRLALAAAAVLIVGAGLVWNTLQTEPDVGPVMRGASASDSLLVGPRGPGTATPLIFTWRPTAGVRQHTVEVFSPSGEVVWTAQVADTTATMPASVHLAPGASYHWWVTFHRDAARGGDLRTAPATFTLRER